MMKAERMIPNIYEQSSDMRTLCRFIDAEAEILEYYTDHILDCYSPEHCPNHLVEELAEHIGFKYNDLKTLMYNRVVLKNFIKHLIRYRGSATGIRNAAAIDIRYRQTYTHKVPNSDNDESSQTVTETVPMQYHESIDIDTAWVDADADAGIIYLFIIAGNYFTPITKEMLAQFEPEPGADWARKDELAKQKADFLAKMYADRMRKLLDFAYLQEYVRPVGMYLLPMVARKVDPYTDLTVKAVRIPEQELNHRNNVFGTPNASMEHEYDRMLFAKVENPEDELSIEPWIRTLYHSQLAGKLSNQYFTAPVFHIEGNFLYYDHSELLEVYKEIIEESGGTMGTTKLGDALYNPNRIDMGTPNYTYGDSTEGDPVSLQGAGVNRITHWPLDYEDNVGFPLERVYQVEATIAYPIITSPDKEFPIYLDVRGGGEGDDTGLTTENSYTLSTDVTESVLDYFAPRVAGYLKNAWTGMHQPAPEYPYNDGDNGTNKNLIITLYDVDDEGKGEYIDADGMFINGKAFTPSEIVPYDPAHNDEPSGSDFIMTLHSSGDHDTMVP